MSLADSDSDENNGFHPNYAVIREIYNGLNGYELLEDELERALAGGAQTIVIEPQRLGEATARWIAVGNCLHRTAITAGMGSLAAGAAWPDKPLIYSPMAALGVLCSLVYQSSWQTDPAINYRVERRLDIDPAVLNLVDSSASPLPVVLVRRNNGATGDTDGSLSKSLCHRAANLFHSAVTLIAVAVSSWRLFKLLRYTASV